MKSVRWSCWLLCTAFATAQNCPSTSVGLTPLSQSGPAHHGHALGLYPGGSQQMPAAHRALGLQRMADVVPRDGSGAPSPNGRIVLLSIGMSNTTQEFSAWLPISAADPQRNAAVQLVDGAQGGQHAAIIADPLSPFWTVVDQRLAAAGATPAQVQVVWLKQAVGHPNQPFPQHAQTLQGYLAQIARNLRARYPNAALCFLSSRIYAGYATTQLNPEPYAYEGGFAARWTIEQQLNQDPALNCDPQQGQVVAPWLAWGPYLWADGMVRRADGLLWHCADFAADGTHPGTSGRQKVAAMLDAFFRGSEFTAPWYLGGSSSTAVFAPFGAGCAGASGVPVIRSTGLPQLGSNFAIGLDQAAVQRPVQLWFALGSGLVPIAGPCTAWLDAASAWPVAMGTSNGLGRLQVLLPVPNHTGLIGLQVFAQWAVDDPAGAPLAGWGGLAVSPAARVVVGL